MALMQRTILIVMLSILLPCCKSSRIRFHSGSSQDENQERVLPVMAAYNIGISLKYAFDAVEETRFRRGGFDKFADVARSHIEAMDGLARGDSELRADGWLGLQAFQKLTARISAECKSELDGTWVDSAFKLFGHTDHQSASRVQEFKAAVATLQDESKIVSDTLARLASETMCPALGREVRDQLMAADAAAKSYTRATGKSLYLAMASEEPTWEGDSLTPLTYADILDKHCFAHDAATSKQVDAESVKEMPVEFTALFENAGVVLNDLLEACPNQWRSVLPDDSFDVAMCVPYLHDLVKHAELKGALSAILSSAVSRLAPVQKWADSSRKAMNALFDVSSVWDVGKAAGSGITYSAVGSMMWIAHRAALRVPIRDECVAAAANLTSAMKHS